MFNTMSDKYREESLDKCCCCPPTDCKPPVIIERILVPYFNPDGSPSNRKYYRYPITCLAAIHQTTDIFSPTLEDILRRINERIDVRQKKLAGGGKDVILTRGRDDGEVGELNKIDYMDFTRRSKVHVPSEYAVFKAMDQNLSDYKIIVDKETTRATAAEDKITDMIRDESNRAHGVENSLNNDIEQLNRDVVMKSDLGDGLLLRDFVIDLSDIANIRWKKSRINIITGSTDTVEGSWTNFDDDIEKLIDNKLDNAEDDHPTVKQNIFDNTDGKVIANTEFIPGSGNLIGRLNITKKSVDGIGEDTVDIVGFRSDDIKAEVHDIMHNEKEITLSFVYNSMEDIREAFAALYA